MIRSRKHKLLIALILVCICAPVLGQEPNETKTELKFEISGEKQQWIVEPMNQIGTGPIKPTHVAVLLIESERIPIIHWNDISNSRVGQTMSQEQRDFLNQGQVRYIRHKEAYREFHWYAISEDDARKMPQAFLEAWTNKVNSKLQPLLKQQEELKKQIAENKKKLQQKLATKEDADAELRKSLKERPYLLNVVLHEGDLVLGTDLPKLTEQMIQEMGKMLDIINVEIVGIQAKLSAIEEYKSKPNVSAAVLARLDEILCEQSIELAGTLARKKQATDSRARYQDVYNLHKQWETAVYRYDKVRGDVLGSQRRLSELKKRLADPTPDMLPPKVYQNKVTIYPVKVKD